MSQQQHQQKEQKRNTISIIIILLIVGMINTIMLYQLYSNSNIVVELQSNVLLDKYIDNNNMGHSSSALRTGGVVHQQQHLQQHIRHVQRPHHEGYVEYHIEIDDDHAHIVYTRQFNAPCGYGMLVFNVGPAANYTPYTYEIYDDAYAYSDNEGLCFLYPSYTGIQKGNTPFWSFNDEMYQTVPLGDRPTQISTRIVVVPNTKPFNTSDTKHPYHGGDYLIIAHGNFYNPSYYKQLKYNINHWPAMSSSEEIMNKLQQLSLITTME